MEMTVRFVDGPLRGQIRTLPYDSLRVTVERLSVTRAIWPEPTEDPLDSSIEHVTYHVLPNPLHDKSFTHIATMNDKFEKRAQVGDTVRSTVTVSAEMIDTPGALEYTRERMYAQMTKLADEAGMVLVDVRLTAAKQRETKSGQHLTVLTGTAIAMPKGWDDPADVH